MSDHPNLSGMTPAEQVAALGLAVGDTIETRSEYPNGGWVENRWTILYAHAGELVWLNRWRQSIEPDYWRAGGVYHGMGGLDRDWRKISSDPALDPAEPLRRELRSVWAVLDRLYNLSSHILSKRERYPVRDWLARNKAFGPGGEGQL